MARLIDARWLAMACLIGLILACFGPALRPDRQLAYRDFSDFYYPLYQRVQQEWSAGRLPLWSPEENAGTPMLGNPTSAVLYPGKLIYATLPYPMAAKVYPLAHLMLAFGAMVILLRHWNVSGYGTALGGLAYAFGAPLLTQYANVVFLVGAAWMPLGFRFADGWIRSERPRNLAGLAIVLAMQVLGGDPEAAYLTASASGALAFGRAMIGEPLGRERRVALTLLGVVVAYGCLLGLEVANLPGIAPRAGIKVPPRPWWIPSTSTASLFGWTVVGLVLVVRKRSQSRLRTALGGLIVAGLIGAAITGVQLLPTLEYIGLSTRTGPDHGVDVYAFSIHPARLAEWAWPGLFGSTSLRDHKWLTALPPTENFQVWLTSTYLGGLTLILAVAGLGVRGSRGWMTAIALGATLAGLGSFASPLFWARASARPAANLGAVEQPEPELPRPDGRLRDGDGSAYWFLATALPGFRSFRYPGKLFIPASLGIAALAGLGFDRLRDGRKSLSTLLALAMLGIGIGGLVIVWVWPGPILDLLRGRSEAATSVFGPLDQTGAFDDLRRGLAHGSLVFLVSLVFCRLAPRRPKVVGALALSLMAADLALVNRSEVGTVAQASYDADSRVAARIRQAEQSDPDQGPFRVFRPLGWVPISWNRKAATNRLDQIVGWERDTLRAKYELGLGLSSSFSHGTTELADYAPFFEPFRVQPDPTTARRLGLEPGRLVNYFPRRGLDLWNTRYFILPTRMAWTSQVRGFGSLLPEADAIYPPPFSGLDRKVQLERWGLEEDVQVLRNRAAFPRAWVVHSVIAGKPSEVSDRNQKIRTMTEILYQDDELWHVESRSVVDPRQVAWVEAPASKLAGLSGAQEGSEPVKVVQGDDPTQIQLEVTMSSPGLVVLADVFYPGWQLEIDDQPAEILRVNRAMRGAVVPAGAHRLVYTYRPLSLRSGLVVSGFGVVAWFWVWFASGRLKGSRGPAKAAE